MRDDSHLSPAPSDLAERLQLFAKAVGAECADMAAMHSLDEGIVLLSLDVLRTELNSLISDWPQLEPDEFFRLKDLGEEAFLQRIAMHLTAQKGTA